MYTYKQMLTNVYTYIYKYRRQRLRGCQHCGDSRHTPPRSSEICRETWQTRSAPSSCPYIHSLLCRRLEYDHMTDPNLFYFSRSWDEIASFDSLEMLQCLFTSTYLTSEPKGKTLWCEARCDQNEWASRTVRTHTRKCRVRMHKFASERTHEFVPLSLSLLPEGRAEPQASSANPCVPVVPNRGHSVDDLNQESAVRMLLVAVLPSMGFFCCRAT